MRIFRVRSESIYLWRVESGSVIFLEGRIRIQGKPTRIRNPGSCSAQRVMHTTVLPSTKLPTCQVSARSANLVSKNVLMSNCPNWHFSGFFFLIYGFSKSYPTSRGCRSTSLSITYWSSARSKLILSSRNTGTMNMFIAIIFYAELNFIVFNALKAN